MLTADQLRTFLRQSNLIEGIDREVTDREMSAALAFLDCPFIAVADLEILVSGLQPGTKLRDKPGMDVQVGDHIPIAGGPAVRRWLKAVMKHANNRTRNPHQLHMDYEYLHPFMDGNGRSGRLLWVWQMQGELWSWVKLPLSFLQAFYYQTLREPRP